MFTAETAPDEVHTRVVRLHEEWVPHGYQKRARAHLMETHAGALFLDPGLGKTSVVIDAFRLLKEAGMVERMLVVAPLRVCQLVWRQEGKKWSQFRDLTFTLLHGPKKDERLHEDTDIHLINPEGIAWFTKKFFGRSDIPYDVVTIDELTKFKNHTAQRSKKLRKKLQNVRYRWGLTGTPAPNGYMDLFGQMLILDDGLSLGKYITHFRDMYFIRGYDGFSYELRPGADERIEAKIAPYVLRMSADDYLELPPLVDNIITIDMPPSVRAQYDEMKKEMLLALPEGVVTGSNSGAIYSKLKQMSNGAVYLSDPSEGEVSRKKQWVELHSLKLDALEELIEELSGKPLLVAYEFQHDLERIRARLGEDTPTLSGVSAKKVEELEARWNRGELPVLLVHPASAGHGLNLQGSAASHVCWFSRPWDLELYDQLIRRLRRQGSDADRIVNHVLCVRGTLDEDTGEVLREKDTTQNRLLTALNAEIMRDNPATTAPKGAEPMEMDTMALKKLGFKGQGAAPAENTEAEKPAMPKGWGSAPAAPAQEPQAAAQDDAPAKPKGWGPPAGVETPESEQRANIQSRLRAPAPAAPQEEEEEEVPASVKALNAFPQGVVDQLNGDDAEEEEGGSGDDPVDPWKGLGTRYVNALMAAEVESAEEAYGFGKKQLIDNVEGFGEKGWEELAAIFEDDVPAVEAGTAPDDDAPAVTQAVPKGWGQANTGKSPEEQVTQDKADFERKMVEPEPSLRNVKEEKAAQYAMERAMEERLSDYHPGVSISINIHGLTKTQIARLFESLANQYGEE